MSTDPREKFKISWQGACYMVERSGSDRNIYKITGERCCYLFARDFYGAWEELTSSPGAPRLPAGKIGNLIESHFKIADPNEPAAY